MRDREEGDILPELRSEGRLDDGVGLVVDRGRRLVKDEQLALAHDRASEREDLALADGEVRATTGDLAVERDARLVGLALQAEETGGAERVVEHRIVVLAEGIEVLAEGAAEQLGL